MRLKTEKVARILVLAALMLVSAYTGHGFGSFAVGGALRASADQALTGAVVGVIFGFFAFGVIWKSPKDQ
jgi:hypothetical protein